MPVGLKLAAEPIYISKVSNAFIVIAAHVHKFSAHVDISCTTFPFQHNGGHHAPFHVIFKLA